MAPAARAEMQGPMRSRISDLLGGAQLGATQEGQAWCLKALHPADTSVQSSPCPVQETRAFASVAFTQMDVLQHPGMAGGFDPAIPWSVEIHVHRDPILLYSYHMSNSAGAFKNGYVWNNQLSNVGATTYEQAFELFRMLAEKFRITSHSLTGYFDAASQSDQGHVVAVQTDLPRMVVAARGNPVAAFDLGAHVPWTFFQDPVPTYDNALQTSRAYQGNANAGFYIPSKLAQVGVWTHTNQSQGLLGTVPPPYPPGPPGTLPFQKLGAPSYEADESYSRFQNSFPWMDGSPAGPHLVFPQTDQGLSSIFYTGLAATSSIRLTFRETIDMMVRPGTAYAPFVRMPPPVDDLAISMYSEVSRRMPDAFPSNHNNLGALLPLISTVASYVLPKIAGILPDFIQRKVALSQLEGAKPTLWSAFSGTSATPGVLTEAENAQVAALRAKIADGTAQASDLQQYANLAKKKQGTGVQVAGSGLAALLNKVSKQMAGLGSGGDAAPAKKRRKTTKKRKSKK